MTSSLRTERNLRNALMFMPIPIGVTTLAGEVVLFNQAFTAAFGYELTDLSSVEVWFRLAYPDPAYRAEVEKTWAADVSVALRSGGATMRREYRITHKRGDLRRVIVTARAVDDLLITAFEDITQRMLDEEELARHRQHLEELVAERTRELARKNEALEAALQQLRQAQEQLIQESKLASLGALVAGIAHELNTPIGNARTASTTLVDVSQGFARRLDEAAGLRKSDLREFLAQVSDGAGLLDRNLVRASDLIHSFKQVAVDRTSSQRRRFNLLRVVDEVITTLRPSLKKTPFELVTDIDPTIEMDGFPGPLGQVLVNLIDNALIHGLAERAHGTIRVTARRQGDQVAFTVADDGNGIPKEHLGRVFDPFFTTKFGQGGSGLGLNIVFNIVTGLLGGTVGVDSQTGQGARFSILMPLEQPAPA